jgi:hypothetical protein
MAREPHAMAAEYLTGKALQPVAVDGSRRHLLGQRYPQAGQGGVSRGHMQDSARASEFSRAAKRG